MSSWPKSFIAQIELGSHELGMLKLIDIAFGFPHSSITKPDPFPPDEHAHESQGRS